VYDIREARAEGPRGWHVKDNSKESNLQASLFNREFCKTIK